MDERAIKARLSELLQEDSTNYTEILSLSNRLVGFDKDNVRFSVDAGVIDRLGLELVSRQETAVSELVKNAYDADALSVKLIFINANTVGGTLIIEDTGQGMTRDELINGFMRISSTSKVHEPISKKFNRRRSGRKGIGRFAVQRLGSKLTIRTQVPDALNGYELQINWAQYVRDRNLFDITNQIKEIPIQGTHGTTLVIEGLKDKWTEAAINRVYRYVGDILQPFPLGRVDGESRGDPGFEVQFYRKDEGRELVEVVNDKIMIYDHALAVIDGTIDEHHQGHYSVHSTRLDIDFADKVGADPDNKDVPFAQLKNVKLRAYYYIYDTDLIPRMHMTAIRNLAKLAGGIRLYRNGFRVLPYGEPGDDWLSLDESIRRRSILPVHGNTSFFGFVQITDESGEFEETSSREGLINNEALISLRNFAYRVLLSAVIKVSEVRGIKIASGQRRDEYGNWEQIEVRINNIAHSIEGLDTALLEGDAITLLRDCSRAIQRQLHEIKDTLVEGQKQLMHERAMLRVLSSMGLTTSQFVHEMLHQFDSISVSLDFAKNSTTEEERLKWIETLELHFSQLTSYMSYFKGIVSKIVIKQLEPIELRTVVKPFVSTVTRDAKFAQIDIAHDFEGYNLYTPPMHPSEWASILFNLYSNSKKAIKRANRERGKILIQCGREDRCIFLRFSDNGDGIPEENRKRIFDEFYTTVSQPNWGDAESSDIGSGMGLGLKIVKDIVLSYNGIIEVVPEEQGYETSIQINIPQKNRNYG